MMSNSFVQEKTNSLSPYHLEEVSVRLLGIASCILT